MNSLLTGSYGADNVRIWHKVKHLLLNGKICKASERLIHDMVQTTYMENVFGLNFGEDLWAGPTLYDLYSVETPNTTEMYEEE